MGNTIKIHYIWLKDCYCIHNQSFNFSTKYKFRYDPQNRTVTLDEKNSSYIDNFFGDNIDLTAVVGQNGTGKTTLLRFVQGLRDGEIINTECVIVCELSDGFCAARYYKQENEITCDQLQIKGCKNIDENTFREYNFQKQRFIFSKYFRFVYLTEMFNMNQYTASIAGGDDLSFASVLYDQTEYGDEEKHINNPVLRYIHRITDWQLAFFANGREYTEQFKINHPSYIYVELNYDRNAFADFYVRVKSDGKERAKSSQESELKEKARKCSDFFLCKSKSADNITLRDEYATAIFMNIFSSLHYVSGIANDKAERILGLIEQACNSSDSKNAWDNVCKLILRIKENNQNFEDLLNNRVVKADKKIDYIPVEAGRYIEFMDYLYVFLSDENIRYKKLPLTSTIMIPTADNMEEVRTFFNNYKKCVRIVDFLSFSWRLSSGETLLLNQFGKLMHLLKKDNRGKYYLPEDVNSDTPAKNAVILLDEAEVAFHPEWQRIYFDAFLEFVKKNISGRETHVQIILATHSPIILSDIPKQNAIFLAKDGDKITVYNDNKETFAANIFSLYQNAFFLNESGIGVFAERKLCDLIKKIHKLSEEQVPTQSSKDEIIREIECIGDPYIRHKFEMEYENMIELLPASKLDAEIKETEKRLTELKKRLRDLEERYAEN